jgi:hypothetical protein
MALYTGLKNTLYFGLLILSSFLSFFFIFINVEEILQRSTGRYTMFSQMSWLTDSQAVYYCSFLTLVFIILLTLLGHRLYHKNRKGATRISLLTFAFAITILFCETFLYNKAI